MELGLDPASYWSLTPRLMAAIIEARVAALKREKAERDWTVWHTAMLGRMAKPPSFRQFTGGKAAPKSMRPQTLEEMVAVAKRLAGVEG